MVDRDRRRRDDEEDFCCCKDEMACLLKRLNRDTCSIVEVILTSGSECCSITGTICDVRKNGCILVLIETPQGVRTHQPPPFQNGTRKCFIAVDKIAAVCEVCGNDFPPGPPMTNKNQGEESN